MMSDNPILVECAVAQLIPLGPSMPKKGSKFDHVAIRNNQFKGDPGFAWLNYFTYTPSNALITIRLFFDC